MLSNSVIKDYDSIAKDNVPVLVKFVDISTDITRMAIPMATLAGSNATAEQVNKAQKTIETTIEGFEKHAKEYEVFPYAPGEEEAWNNFKTNHWEPLKNISNEMLKLSRGSLEDQRKRDQLYETKYAEMRTKRREALDKVITIQTAYAKLKAERAQERDSIKNRLTAIISVIVILLSVTTGYLLISTISGAFKDLSEELKKLIEAASTGKLTTRGDTQKINFEFAFIVEGFNKTLDYVLAPINEASQVLQKMA